MSRKKNSVMKIAVLGDGGWGTALALTAYNNGHHVIVWGAFQENVDAVNRDHKNRFLAGVDLPQDLPFTTDMKEAVSGAQLEGGLLDPLRGPVERGKVGGPLRLEERAVGVIRSDDSRSVQFARGARSRAPAGGQEDAHQKTEEQDKAACPFAGLYVMFHFVLRTVNRRRSS